MTPAATTAVEARPRGPYRLDHTASVTGLDGVTRRRDGVLRRLLHVGAAPVAVTAWQPAADRVCFRAAGPRAEAEEAIARLRRALGVDDDLSAFNARFRHDPLLGPAIRRRPGLRVLRHPDPFQALCWAITEQLIEFRRAAAIQRRLVWRFGREAGGLHDAPSAAAIAARAPCELEALDLSHTRAVALVKVARAVDRGRLDLAALERRPTAEVRARLEAFPGIGRWTSEVLCLRGYGRMDVVPAGDLGLLKLAGTILGVGRKADEEATRALFERYEPYAGLAAVHLMRATRSSRAYGDPRPGRKLSSSASPTRGGRGTRPFSNIQAA